VSVFEEEIVVKLSGFIALRKLTRCLVRFAPIECILILEASVWEFVALRLDALVMFLGQKRLLKESDIKLAD
jgi:hypothetical protein